MLFNSIPYLVFLPLVFIIYWYLKQYLEWQNLFLLVASYFFYGWWDIRFLGLIAISTLIDYFIGISLENQKKRSIRKTLIYLSVLCNLGLLGFFKYFNFFIYSWQESWNSMGVETNLSSLNIILPVGISFYTFQTLSYTIDIYRNNIKPTRNLINFAGFVSFFPQLVAGPIERASNLLPQFENKRSFDKDRAISGLNLILWGLFKKIVIADNCATYVNAIFNDFNSLNSGTLLLGAIYFSIQIYADFSGYSDIAIGTARLLGFDLMKNFDYPYFSRNIGEFWRRWHISLSTWFRDYLYIPLGGSKGPTFQIIRNTFIIFLVTGFWHGANWTFLVYGFLHSLFFLPLILRRKNRKHLDQVAKGKNHPSLIEFYQIITTFGLVTFARIFFRSETVTDAFLYIKRLFSNLHFEIEYLPIERYSIEMILIITGFVLFEWFHREKEHPFKGKYKWVKINAIILLLLTLGVYSDHQEFIYFQF